MLANDTTSENWKKISGLFRDILPQKRIFSFLKIRKWIYFVFFNRQKWEEKIAKIFRYLYLV